MVQSTPSLGIILDHQCYRGTAVAINFTKAGKVIVGHRCPRPGRQNLSDEQVWELPQGAIDWFEATSRYETAYVAAIRENREELGYKQSDLIPLIALKDHPVYPIVESNPDGQISKYDFNLLGCAAFLVRDNAEVNLNSGFNNQKPEFDAYRAVDLADLPLICPPHKRPAYEAIVRALAPVAQALISISNQDMPPTVRAAFVTQHRFVMAAKEAGQLANEIPDFPGIRMSSRDAYFRNYRRARLSGSLAAAVG